MKKSQHGLTYGPSDLCTFMSTPFGSWMDRYALENPEWSAGIDKEADAMLSLLAGKGDTHETGFLQSLERKYGADQIAVIDTSDIARAQTQTQAALKSGPQIIYQAYLQRDNFSGYADFLFRVNQPSALGAYSYEPWDAKFARAIKPYFLMQLCTYSWMLEASQRRLPAEVAIVLGDQSIKRFRLAKYYSYFKMMKQQFLMLQEQFTNDLNEQPNPDFYTDYGRWQQYAENLLQQRDSLRQVANIRTNQINALYAQGIQSMAALSTTDADSIKSMGDETFSKLKAQASVQIQSRQAGKPAYKILKNNENGLASLPPLSDSDLFFDIEGHPLFEKELETGRETGLEYCWGVSHYGSDTTSGKHYAFAEWWAHNAEQEREAFEGFIDWCYARWQKDPALHIYHYASYEVTALRKLSTRYHTRQKEVSELLSQGVFIDLYKIVRNGMIIGEPNYSIKSVEHLYRDKRDTEVASGGDSVVLYEQWREKGGDTAWTNQPNGRAAWLAHPDSFDWSQWPELKAIRDYNIDDCESTLALVHWLRDLQSAEGISYQAPPAAPETEPPSAQAQARRERQHALQEIQASLIHQFETSETLRADPIADLLAALIGFHQREQKVGAWAYFDRLEKSEAELYDDPTAITDVRLYEEKQTDNKIIFRGQYDGAQMIRTDKFTKAAVFGTNITLSNIEFIKTGDAAKGELLVSLKIDQTATSMEAVKLLTTTPITLMGQEPHINTQALETRICEIARRYFNTGELSPLLSTLLKREAPRFIGESPLPVTRKRFQDDDSYNLGIRKTVAQLAHSCLCIQGPPGAGKTYTAKQVIQHLIKMGHRIGITSNSHAAIENLLVPLSELAPEYQLAKVGPSSANATEFHERYPSESYPNLNFRRDMKFTRKQPYRSFAVVGATAFGFANETAINDPVDYLFVDEASQVSLANLVAISPAAKNIVLMGDQMQLEQPTQGAHPGDTGRSALEFLLYNHPVIPEHKGLFLERTYRMHPDVCQPLSDIIYEGKLTAADQNSQIKLEIEQPNLIQKSYGIQFVPTPHQGNLQSSTEEAQRVKSLISEVLTGTFTDNSGESRPMTREDILIVSPYNMQVNLLIETLGQTYRIGTIDKFQGQQAPVVIVSFGMSDVNESARGLDFVFDLNRINVAISHAQALALLVATPNLHHTSANTIEQIEKINLMCRLVEP